MKRSVIARTNPCAPPVTTAQRPLRSIWFIAQSLVSVMRGLDPRIHPSSQDSFEGWIAGSSPAMTVFVVVSQRPAAVDDVGDAGGEGALVAGKVYRERADLFRRAEPAHWLAADEHFAPAGTCRGGAVQHRGRLDGAGADRVAADAFGDEVGGDCAGQRRDRGLGRAVDVAVGRRLEHAGGRGDVDDRTVAGL